MKDNIWKILAVLFFMLSVTQFLLGYKQNKDLETETTIRIKELEMKIKQDSLKMLELQNNAIQKGKYD
jgi:hypothetical protein